MRPNSFYLSIIFGLNLFSIGKIQAQQNSLEAEDYVQFLDGLGFIGKTSVGHFLFQCTESEVLVKEIGESSDFPINSCKDCKGDREFRLSIDDFVETVWSGIRLDPTKIENPELKAYGFAQSINFYSGSENSDTVKKLLSEYLEKKSELSRLEGRVQQLGSSGYYENAISRLKAGVLNSRAAYVLAEPTGSAIRNVHARIRGSLAENCDKGVTVVNDSFLQSIVQGFINFAENEECGDGQKPCFERIFTSKGITVDVLVKKISAKEFNSERSLHRIVVKSRHDQKIYDTEPVDFLKAEELCSQKTQSGKTHKYRPVKISDLENLFGEFTKSESESHHRRFLTSAPLGLLASPKSPAHTPTNELNRFYLYGNEEFKIFQHYAGDLVPATGNPSKAFTYCVGEPITNNSEK